jgi:hypothetical protein
MVIEARSAPMQTRLIAGVTFTAGALAAQAAAQEIAPKPWFAPKRPDSHQFFGPVKPRVLSQTPLADPSKTEAPKPRVICGMTVVPADPSIDPGFLKPVPSTTRFTMRIVEPKDCAAPKAPNDPFKAPVPPRFPTDDR